MKYFLAFIIHLLAMPALAHHTIDAAPLHSADQAVTWLVVVTMLLVILAVSRHHKARTSQA